MFERGNDLRYHSAMRVLVAVLSFAPFVFAACDSFKEDVPCADGSCADGGLDGTVADARVATNTDAQPRASTDADADAAVDADADAHAASSGDAGIVLALGNGHSCALLPDHSVKCWGSPDKGELGFGDPAGRDGTTPGPVPGLDHVVALASSPFAQHTCAVIADGGVTCWGRSDYGQAGVDSGPDAAAIVPTHVQGLGSMRGVVGAAEWSSCAALADNSGVQCWGLWSFAFPSDQVSLITGFDGGVVTSLAGTETAYCGAYGEGSAGCWGDDRDDADIFGAPAITAPGVVFRVPGVSDVAQVGAGGTLGGHACAVRKDGSVMCWGVNDDGECGTGAMSPTAPPTVVAGTGTVAQVAAGAHHTCARRTDGKVVCWGGNPKGQCGISGPPHFLVPQEVPGLEHVTDIATGWGHTCAVVDGTSVYCWGSDVAGQVGDGNPRDSAPPTKVAL